MLALPLVLAVDRRPLGDCDGCGVTLPESELLGCASTVPRLLLDRGGYYASSLDYWWCTACAEGLWTQWRAIQARRVTREGQRRLQWLAEQLDMWKAA